MTDNLAATDADHYYGHDHLFSTTVLFDDTGTIQERYEYNAYGKCTVLQDDFTPDGDNISDFENPYLFTGRRLDILDGNSFKIQYSRARYYDAQTGRFLQRDPLGINPAEIEDNPFVIDMQYTDGMSLYQYIKSSVVTGADPFGLVIMCMPNLNPVKKPPVYNPSPNPCLNAPPTSDTSVCNVHNGSTLRKAGVLWDAACICRCAGDSPWDNQVRGCLECFKKADSDMNDAHDKCYKAADDEVGGGYRARADIARRCSHCMIIRLPRWPRLPWIPRFPRWPRIPLPRV